MQLLNIFFLLKDLKNHFFNKLKKFSGYGTYLLQCLLALFEGFYSYFLRIGFIPRYPYNFRYVVIVSFTFTVHIIYIYIYISIGLYIYAMGLYIYIYINPLLRCGLDIESTECFLLHRFPS